MTILLEMRGIIWDITGIYMVVRKIFNFSPSTLSGMIDEKLIEKFYSKLFTMPRKRITVVIGLITILFASLLNGTVSKTFFAQRYFFIGLSLIIAIYLASVFLSLALTSRRIFFLSLFILIFVEFFDFIAIHILRNFNLIVMAPATMAAGLTMILYFTSEASEVKTAIISFTLLILVYPVDFYFSFEAPHRFSSYLLTTFAGVLLSWVFLKYIDRDYGNFNVKRMLRAFLLFWLTTLPEYFEKELLKVSELKRGWVKCLRIGDVELISTSFHPGPLRNIGGAMLVERVLEGRKAIYMHSTVKHSSNPSSSKDVKRIVSAISCSDRDLRAKRPVEVEGNNFSLKIFPFDSVTLIFISGKTAIDDIPEEINKFAEKIFGETIIVDCHNCHRRNYEIGSEEIMELITLFEKGKEKLTNNGLAKDESFDESNSIGYFFTSKRIETPNTCGKIGMLILDYEGCRYGILMLDGNNVNCEFKEELEYLLEDNGISPVILSTDNHSKTGISPKIGYMPVGSDDMERRTIIDFVVGVVSGLEDKQLRSGKISYGKREVEVNVMGDAFFKSVENAFRDMGEKSIYLFFIVIFLQLVVSVMLGSVIF
jgi:putative membrane protein